MQLLFMTLEMWMFQTTLTYRWLNSASYRGLLISTEIILCKALGNTLTSFWRLCKQRFVT